MLEFLLSDGNAPFLVAILLVAVLAASELIMLLIGFSLGDLAEMMLPDTDGFAEGPLSYLGFGKLPIGILLVLYATIFGLAGFGIQSVVTSFGLPMLMPTIASGLAAVATVPVVAAVAPIFGAVLPKDETYVASIGDLVGQIGRIGSGTAKPDLPAECKVTDGHGGHLYVQVVPAAGDAPIPSGTEVVITRRLENGFEAAPLERKPKEHPLDFRI